jgi:lambda family phage portal protein
MSRSAWLDRAIGFLSPETGLRRERARVARDLLQRHYEGASTGRRTQGWHKSLADVNAATGPFVGRLRDIARDLVRNNPYAESALSTIVDHTVGWGIVAKPKQKNARALAMWNAWANSTACDADGRHDFSGLQQLVLRTVVESGECLVRRRIRRPEDGLPIPLQLQVLEPDYLDTLKQVPNLPNGGRIVHGVEFDAIGRRVAYWLFKEHPGNTLTTVAQSDRIPAEEILHVFRSSRAGQVRAGTWFAPVLVRFKDFDEYEDATLVKQKIAACLAVITSDVDGSSPALGVADDTNNPGIDSLEPGAIFNLPPGRSVDVVQPPAVNDYDAYTRVSLRAIATGIGVTYEDLTGDYTNLPFSAARMSRLRHYARVYNWRWNLIVPQFCAPVWGWAMQAAAVMGLSDVPAVAWTAPPVPMIEPDKEGLAYQRNIRSGIMTLSEAIRERGYDPEELLDEMAADNATLDALGLVLDSDARKMTQAGQLQGTVAANNGNAAAAVTEAQA